MLVKVQGLMCAFLVKYNIILCRLDRYLVSIRVQNLCIRAQNIYARI